MATLGEFLAGKSLFSSIEQVEAFPFIVGDAVNLDLILTINYGQRILFNPYADLEIEKVAQILVKQHGEKWRDYLKIEALKENVNDRREVSENITESENKVNTRDEVNKVAAFNSADLIDNDGSTISNSDNNSGEKVRTLTDENISPQKSYALLSNMARDSIVKNVMQDISKSLTLAIY